MTKASYKTQQPPRGHARLLLPADHDDNTSTGLHTRVANVPKPLIICFHGSGETCSPTWDALATALVTTLRCRVLLYDRGSGNLRPADVAAEMWDYITATTSTAANEIRSGSGKQENENEQETEDAANDTWPRDAETKMDLRGPYLLIAHSYGGAFARAFVQHEYDQEQENGYLIRRWKKMKKKRKSGHRVTGLVLVETGQEGGLDPDVDERQIRETIMGTRPVCVIRGNSLLQKWSELESKEKALNGEMEGGNIAEELTTRRRMLATEREMLACVDAEDERLKRRQLGLSRMTRFVHLPDCGHDVISRRPGGVVDAVRWVLEHAEEDEKGQGDKEEEAEEEEAGQEEGSEGMGDWKLALEKLRRFGLWW
ncbi:Alpha/Beta hydrolase protein [Xylaria sp. FL0043]|nr:Alpha/Beta hydrolase protein [Xylaria sp. FL0043]